MDVANYSDLQTTALAYLNRDDPTIIPVPLAISLLESKANRTLRTNDMLVEVTGNITAGSTTLPLPADYLATLTFRLQHNNGYGWGAPIRFVSESEANKRRQHPHFNFPNQPWYTIFGGNIEIIGIHGALADTPYTLRYYQQIPSLSDANPTNWLLLKSPDLYVYGTLLELEAFLMNDERIPLWKQAYDMIIQDMRIQSDEARFPMGGKHMTWRSFG